VSLETPPPRRRVRVVIGAGALFALLLVVVVWSIWSTRSSHRISDEDGIPPLPGEGWVRIEPGAFWMGSPHDELGRYSDEHLHQVRLTRAFEVMTTPVIQSQWYSLMGNNPSCFQSSGYSLCSTSNANPNAPVENVSWWDAAAYANARSRAAGLPECYRLEGCSGAAGVDLRCTGVTVTASGADPYLCTGYRLPTEAEWEYAARAGDTRATYNGELTAMECDDITIQAIAWFCGNDESRTHPVAQKRANAWGLFDLLGNVWEWTHDWYTSSLGPDLVTDPWGPESGSLRVLRGGSWYYGAQFARAASRYSIDPDTKNFFFGFRIARTIEP